MSKQYATTAAGRQSIPLPEKFLCRVCTKWRPPVQYSNKELKGYINKMVRGARITPITARLRCRCCAGGPLHELECLGPCAETKSINAFSKSARQSGGSNWCMACTLWKESAEPSVSIQAPPTGSNLEKRSYISKNLGDEYSDPEADEGDNDYDYFNSGPRVSQPATQSTIRTFEGSNSTRGFNFSTAYSDGDGDDDDDDNSLTSASNRWENFSFGSTATLSQNPHPITFNAWDPSGQQHTMNANFSTNQRVNQPLSDPKSGWAKPVGSRNAGRVYRAEQSAPDFSERTFDFHSADNDDLIDL